MICLNCGYCCSNMLVVIVDDPKKGIQQDNLIIHEGNGKPCQHLRRVLNEPGKFTCVCHSEKWYKKTPCFAHGQIERSPDDVCRMGEYILRHGLNTNAKSFCKTEKVT